jgi:uncharacterized lipoprotein YehR (DUF1307 family)
MMKKLLLFVFASSLLVGLAGCADEYNKNPAGEAAGEKKEYSAEDATAAVPKRGGSEGE